MVLPAEDLSPGPVEPFLAGGDAGEKRVNYDFQLRSVRAPVFNRVAASGKTLVVCQVRSVPFFLLPEDGARQTDGR